MGSIFSSPTLEIKQEREIVPENNHLHDSMIKVLQIWFDINVPKNLKLHKKIIPVDILNIIYDFAHEPFKYIIFILLDHSFLIKLTRKIPYNIYSSFLSLFSSQNSLTCNINVGND